MTALGKGKQLKSGKRTKVVRKVETQGRVAKVTAQCLYQGQPVLKKKDRKQLCAITVNQTRNNAKVSVRPKCATDLKVRTRVVMRGVPGEGKVTWDRTWKVKRDTSDQCRLSGNG